MNPFMQDSIMSSTGMPTLGRRAKGFGASPFGPGGPSPVHQMNFLMGGMGRHGLHNTPFGAGSYPNPQAPFPLRYTAAPVMPMSMGPMGGDFMSPFPSSPYGGSMCMPMGMPTGFPPWLMAGAGGGLLDGLDGADDTGVWDGDDDVEGLSPFDIFYRTQRRSKRKGKGCGMYGMPTMPMPGMGTHNMTMPMCMPMGMGMGMGMGGGGPIGCM